MKKIAILLAALMITAVSFQSCKARGEDCGAYQGSKKSSRSHR